MDIINLEYFFLIFHIDIKPKSSKQPINIK